MSPYWQLQRPRHEHGSGYAKHPAHKTSWNPTRVAPSPAPQCALLSACAARQSRTACVSSSAAAAAALDATRPSDVPAALSQVSLAGACPGGASAGFLQYGADRLSPENRSMCAG